MSRMSTVMKSYRIGNEKRNGCDKKCKKRKLTARQDLKRKKNAERMREKRKNASIRKRERQADRLAKQKRRENKEIRELEYERCKLRRQKRRENEETRETENKKSKVKMRKRRENSEKRGVEKLKDAKSKRMRREKIEVINARTSQIMRRKRSKDEIQKKERAKNREKMRRKRQDERFRLLEKNRRLNRSNDEQFTLSAYFHSIKSGPTHACSSCDNLFFRKSIQVFQCSNLNGKMREILEDKFPFLLTLESFMMCSTCKRSITRGDIPRLSIVNGLRFPAYPENLTPMTVLEERLVSPRIPFMNIRQLGIDKQYGACGSVVNVPVSVDNMVSVLPRTMDESQTIQLKLMRRMSYKRPYIYETIRPAVVHQWTEFLVNQPLYQEHGITMNEDYIHSHVRNEEDFVVENADGKYLVVGHGQRDVETLEHMKSALETECCISDKAENLDQHADDPVSGKYSCEMFTPMYESNQAFAIESVAGDGNCMFRSLAVGLYGDESKHKQLRRESVEYVSQMCKIFSPAVQACSVGLPINSKDAYVRYMGQDGVYGTDVELTAICVLHQISVKVYFRENRPPVMKENDEARQTIFLLYSGVIDNGHYDALVPMPRAVGSTEKASSVSAEERKDANKQLEVEMEEGSMSDDEWEEPDPEPLNPGGQETLIEPVQIGIKFAPGGQIPLPIFFDEHAEELSFPSIFCGQKRTLTRKLSVKEVAKSELRRKDRRCANSIANVFYKHMRCTMATVSNAISLCVRKSRRTEGVSAGQLLNSDFVEGMVRRDEGFEMLRGERSSPAYWESKKKRTHGND